MLFNTFEISVLTFFLRFVSFGFHQKQKMVGPAPCEVSSRRGYSRLGGGIDPPNPVGAAIAARWTAAAVPGAWLRAAPEDGAAAEAA